MTTTVLPCMMLNIFSNSAVLICVLVLFGGCSKNFRLPPQSTEMTHETWDKLLKQHVTDHGQVDYVGLVADSAILFDYLSQLSAHVPGQSTTREYQLAYWINAYNAFCASLIVRNYPVKSIQELQPAVKIPLVSTVWDKKFFRINGQKMSLATIEHQILRKDFDEPRIHFAINCASKSCPKLLNEAYTPDKLEAQLNSQARAFLTDSFRNKISPNEIQISKIFSWFGGDFKKEGTLIEFLNQYSPIPIANDAKITHLDYDWSLND